LTIGNQQVEFVVGWVNEPAYVDEVNAIDFWAHYINSTCPQGSVDTTCPVYGLDQSLQVQVLTGGQSQVLTFSPNLSNDVPPLFYGEYTASLMPTVPGSISFTLFGMTFSVHDVNGGSSDDTKAIAFGKADGGKGYYIGISGGVSMDESGFGIAPDLTPTLVRERILATLANIREQAA
jgi:hypothetical protein